MNSWAFSSVLVFLAALLHPGFPGMGSSRVHLAAFPASVAPLIRWETVPPMEASPSQRSKFQLHGAILRAPSLSNPNLVLCIFSLGFLLPVSISLTSWNWFTLFITLPFSLSRNHYSFLSCYDSILTSLPWLTFQSRLSQHTECFFKNANLFMLVLCLCLLNHPSQIFLMVYRPFMMFLCFTVGVLFSLSSLIFTPHASYNLNCFF